ncbi:MAG: type 2 isopentenyl-diphosphate Delta-isomerase [Thermoanaerobaculia bacterium]|nr:type 2 isopentenyl-diphosphate Delta-isomerase [Thermoanaerobaculia bacterium]
MSTALVSSADVQREAADGDDRDRKLEHIELALDQRTQSEERYFDQWRFDHEALPELDLDEIDLSCQFLGKRLAAPILVSCMTGGTADAAAINRNLAEAAERAGVAVGVGSQRAAIERPDQTETFRMREVAPSVPLLGNLGAVQLNYGFGINECRRAVEMVGADALAIHLNPLQEALQPEGQCDFRGLTAKIGHLVDELEVPVVVKEIGCGLTASTARKLRDVGVRYVDTAGVGGTSWARIEAARAGDAPLGEVFSGWGVPTPLSIRQLVAIDGLTVIGSGGVRSGLDVAKAIALGASVVGLAQPFLQPAVQGADAVYTKIMRIVRELRITMFCLGARTLDDLSRTPIHPLSS